VTTPSRDLRRADRAHARARPTKVEATIFVSDSDLWASRRLQHQTRERWYRGITL